VIVTPRAGDTVVQVVAPSVPATLATVDPVPVEPSIAVGEPAPEAVLAPVKPAKSKPTPAATTKSTKPSASKAKKPKTKSKRVSRPKAAK
jgi:hypothetical protein